MERLLGERKHATPAELVSTSTGRCAGKARGKDMSVSRAAGEGYIIIVDTNQYAGGFDRQMCSYVTAQIGDCGVDWKIAEEARKEMSGPYRCWFEQNIREVADDHGNYRPVSIGQSPGWWNDGWGNEWPESVEADAPEVLKKTEKSLRRECKDVPLLLKSRLDALKDNGVVKHAAYRSVEIFLGEEPPIEFRDAICQRIVDFTKKHPDFEVKVESIRFVKRIVEIRDEEI